MDGSSQKVYGSIVCVGVGAGQWLCIYPEVLWPEHMSKNAQERGNKNLVVLQVECLDCFLSIYVAYSRDIIKAVSFKQCLYRTFRE
jgi:hypothetical protein